MIMILLNKVLIGIMSFWLGCYFCTSTVVQLQLAPAFLADLISKLVYIDFHRVIGPKRKYAFSLLSGGDIQQGTWVRRCEPTMMPPFFPLEQMFFRRTMCAYMCYSGKHIGLIRCFQKHCCLQGKKKHCSVLSLLERNGHTSHQKSMLSACAQVLQVISAQLLHHSRLILCFNYIFSSLFRFLFLTD